MNNSVFIKSLYAKCKMHGYGDAQVVLSDLELLSLISISIRDLKWSAEELGICAIELPNDAYYQIPLSWFDELENYELMPDTIVNALTSCFKKDNDFGLFIENLSALHRRRVKYKRILTSQPLPNMEQIGPRALLEYGSCDTTLLANWMTWRKWIYDIDNRSAQETGYLFEPLLASCLGGESVGSKNSPVKRLDSEGKPTTKGRQIDCFVPTNNRTYELKLRVTIAASGQGRFGEELSFPVESEAAGFTPVLLVLDPNPSSKLTDLSNKYLESGGAFYHGEEAWDHMEEEAGEVVSVFINKYIKPAISEIEKVEIPLLQSIKLNFSENSIEISNDDNSYVIDRI